MIARSDGKPVDFGRYEGHYGVLSDPKQWVSTMMRFHLRLMDGM